MGNKSLVRFFQLVILAFIPGFLAAQPKQDAKDSTSRLLEEVIIAGVRAGSQVPVTEITLNTAQIKRNYAGQEMPVILSTTPSFTWYSDGGHFTGYSYMRLRGIDQTRINFTLNGIPLNEPEDQGVYFSNYPDFLNNVRSIQIQRGVGTSTNGTASFAGSVNFESPSLTDSAGAELQLSAGSYGTWQSSAQVRSGMMKDGLSFYARYSNTRSGGFREHSGNKGQTFFFSVGHFGRKSVFKLTGFTGTSAANMSYLAASASDLALNYRTNYLRDDERDQFYQSLVMLQHSLSLSSNSFLQSSIYYNRLSGNYDVFASPDMLNFAVSSDFLGANVNYQLEKDRLQFNAGLHANQYQRDHFMRIKPDLATNIYFNSGRKSEVSVFTKATYTLQNFTLFADAQLRNVEFKYIPDALVTETFSPVSWSFFNPKIGLTWRVNERRQFYASLGKTSREPTRNDMFGGYDNIDDANYAEVGDFSKVKPESVVNGELGMRFNYQNLKIDANVYTMQFTNEIAAIGQLSYIGLPLRKNVASSYRNGVEVSLEATPGRFQLITQANFSRNRIKEYTSDYDNVTYKDVQPLLTPEAIVNQTIGYKFGRSFRAEATFRYTDRSYLTNTSDNSFVTDPSLITNLSFHLTVLRTHSITLMANNIFDQRYYTSGYVQNNESWYFPMATRNYYLTVNLRF